MSMMHDLAKISALAALAAATPLRAASPTDGVGAVSMDLSPLFAEAGITAQQVKYAGAFVLEDDAAWARGFAAEAAPGSLTLSLTDGGGGAIEHGLRLRYDGAQAVPLTVDVCRFKGDAACVSSSGTIAKTGGTLTVDGATWDLRLYKNPCRAATACELYIPSWELALRAKGDGIFPRIAGLVDWGEGLAVVDVERQRIAFTLSRNADSALKGLGVIESLAYDGQGALVVQGSSGRLLLDFSEDKALLATENELRRAERGIAGLGRANFSTVVALPSIDARLLALRPGFALWTTHSLAWRRSGSPLQSGLKTHGRTLLTTAEAGETVYALERAGTAIRHIAFEGDAVAEVETFAAADPQVLVLSGTRAFELRGTDVKLIGSTGTTMTTLAGATAATLLPAGGALLQRGIGAQCQLHHFVPNSASAASFSESGLAGPCTPSTRFASSGSRRATISTIDGTKLKVHLVTTAKAAE